MERFKNFVFLDKLCEISVFSVFEIYLTQKTRRFHRALMSADSISQKPAKNRQTI